MTILRPALLLDFARCGAIDPRGVFTRVGAGTARRPSGIWQEIVTGAPRFDHDAQALGLMVGASRITTIPNPRAEGGTPGTPGTMPTGWGWTNVPTGMSTEFVGQVTVNGLPGGRFRLFGTNTTGATQQVTLGPAFPTGIAGVPYAAEFRARLADGTMAGITRQRRRLRSNGGSPLDLAPDLSPGIDGTLRTYFLTITGNTGTANVWDAVLFDVAAGVAVNATFDFVAWNLQQGGNFPTSPILPAVGSPAAATRGAEQLVFNLADFVASTGATTGTLVMAGRTAAGVGAAAQAAVTMDDGTASNQVVLTREVGRAMRAQVTVGGASQATATSVATVADQTDLVAAIAWSAGDLAISLNGAAPVTAAPGSVPTLSRLVLAGWEGTVARVAYWPQRIPNAILQSLAA